MAVPQFDHELDGRGSRGANMSLARQRALGYINGKTLANLSQFDPTLYGFGNSDATPADARPKATVTGKKQDATGPAAANARQPFGTANAATPSSGSAANMNPALAQRAAGVIQDFGGFKALSAGFEYTPEPKPGSFGDKYKKEHQAEKHGHKSDLQKLAQSDSRLAAALQENPGLTTVAELVALENKQGGHWHPKHRGPHGGATASAEHSATATTKTADAGKPATGATPKGVAPKVAPSPAGPGGGHH